MVLYLFLISNRNSNSYLQLLGGQYKQGCSLLYLGQIYLQIQPFFFIPKLSPSHHLPSFQQTLQPSEVVVGLLVTVGLIINVRGEVVVRESQLEPVIYTIVGISLIFIKQITSVIIFKLQDNVERQKYEINQQPPIFNSILNGLDIFYMNNSQKLSLEKQSNIKQMTNEELKMFLSKLQDQHDILEATNEELTIQISDLRNAVKCVQAERKDNVAYQIQKKKELQSKIDSLQKGLKYANKNNSSETMQRYKALME